jgi:L-amino acid N-acyltransferase YncA
MPEQLSLDIRPLQPNDWPAVRSIHVEGIATGNATFEKDAPGWEEWNAKHLKAARVVAAAGGRVLGWAALTPVSDRCVYAGVAEVSVYVAADSRRRGVGAALLAALVRASETAGVWTLQARIFPENEASLALHRRNGFRVIGRLERLGKMGERWRDVLFLERRSNVAGI